MTLASNILQKASKRYFAPAQHLWYRAVQKEKAAWSVQVGITNRGLQNIGDVTAVEIVKEDLQKSWIRGNMAKIQAGEELVSLQWEGYSRTAADELYHTVWESVEGTEIIRSPVTGRILQTVDVEEEGEIDDETVLAEIACTEVELGKAARRWIEEVEYDAFLQKTPPGKFAEAIDDSSVSS